MNGDSVQDEDDSEHHYSRFEEPSRHDGEDSRWTLSSSHEFKVNQGGHGGHGGHGHHERPPSVVTAVVSGIINYMLMFGLCCAYGIIMFEDRSLAMHRGLGVKMCLSTAFFTGTMLAFRSEIPVAIGGTDLNPVVFLGGFVVTIAEKLKEDLDIPDPADWKGFGAKDGAVLCQGDHYTQYMAECDEYQDKVRATVIFTVTVSSAILGTIFFCLGRFKATRYVSYVPTSIMEAFLSCVGYKVFKYALKFCKYDPQQFIPAALIGVLLYFLKSLHIGNPAVVIPTMLLMPLGVFYLYIVLAKQEGLGYALDLARKDKLMFDKIEDVNFWEVWTTSIGKSEHVSTKAWAGTLAELCIMVIVTVLDCLLKISSTESKLPVQVHKDYEIQLHGVSNIASVLTGSTVGYMQLKFNVINYGVMGNVRDRRGGMTYALLCGLSLINIEHFNYLPRFFLGMLLFFAGAGFVAENLWGSRKYLSFREWMQILIIVAVFVFTKQLVIAVVVGGLLTGIDFILRYSKVSCIAGHPLRGGEIPMVVRQQPLLQRNLMHIANNWLMVIRLKGFIFFASATSVVHYMKNKFAEQLDVPEYRRLRFIVFDCEQLDGMDASASKSMKKLVEDAGKIGIRCLWTHMSEEVKESLVSRTIVQDQSDLYDGVTQAVDYVYKLALDYRITLHRQLMSLHPVFALYRILLRSQANFEPFIGAFPLDVQRFGCPWQYCTVKKMKRHKTVIHGCGERSLDLYLVHSGAVGVYDQDPSDNALARELGLDPYKNPGPHAIYTQGWFLNREMLTGAPTRNHAVALEDGELLVWSERNWIQMARERPYMSRAISKMIIKQMSRDDELRSLEMTSHMSGTEEDAIDLLEDEGLRRRSALSAHMNTGSIGSTFLQGVTDTLTGNMINMSNMSSSSDKKLDDKNGGDRKVSTRSEWEGKDQGATLDPNMGQSRSHGHRVSHVIESAKIFQLTGAGERPRGLAEARGLPEEMVQKLVGIQTAQVLDGFELYKTIKDVNEDVVMPPMPKGFRQNLEIAFDTYRRSEMETIPWAMCADALMFAGIFSAVLDKNVPMSKMLTRQEFLALGQRATMAPLSASQVRKVQGIFKRSDNDCNGRLDREQLISVFREVFHPDLTIEEVEGVSGAWGVGALERMDFLDFLCVFSRFLRIHEQDWNLLNGFHEVMGKKQFTETDYIQAADLANAFEGQLSIEHAEEMLWATDWRRDGEGNGKQLPFIDFIAAVLMNVDLNPGKLPPAPHNQYVDPTVIGFNSDAKATDVDGRQKFVLIRKATNPTLETSLAQAVPEMEFTEEHKLNFADKMMHDLRDGLAIDSIANIEDNRKNGTGAYETQDGPQAEASRMSQTTSKSATKTGTNSKSVTPGSSDAPEHQESSISMLEKMMAGQSGTARQQSNIAIHHQKSMAAPENNEVQLETFRARIYGLCEMPSSSPAARYLSSFMGVLIVISVLSLFLQPLITPPNKDPPKAEEDFWFFLDAVFTMIFTVEYIIRLAVCNAAGDMTVIDFVKTPSNICDFLALLPFYVELILKSTQDGLRLLRTARLMKLVRLLRVSRVFRLTRLAKHGSGCATLAGPVAMVLTVTWGIYLMNLDES
jgi:MFS superfamily sulfate permease-like transporter/CRP-like cAMP-binding protein/Ca2+-binding EF-hand superfamily protein